MSLAPVTAVFSEIIEWITGAMEAVLAVFYTAGTDGGEGSLTFLGILAVSALAISIFFLILGVIQSFLRFR